MLCIILAIGNHRCAGGITVPSVFYRYSPGCTRVCIALSYSHLHANSGTLCSRDCFLLPYPRPIGNDGQVPLLSTNADGIHATDNAEGPRLINCFFGGLGALLPPVMFLSTSEVPKGLSNAFQFLHCCTLPLHINLAISCSTQATHRGAGILPRILFCRVSSARGEHG